MAAIDDEESCGDDSEDPADDAAKAAKKATRRAAREALIKAGFAGKGRWLAQKVSDALTFEAKGRTDGQIQLFVLITNVTPNQRRFVATAPPQLLKKAMSDAAKAVAKRQKEGK